MINLPTDPCVKRLYAAHSTATQGFALAVLLLGSLECFAQARSIPASFRFQHAQELLQQASLDESKASVQAELMKNSASVEDHHLLGILEGKQQRFAQAIAALQKALQVSPASTKIHNNLGNIYIAMQKTDLAEKEFRKVLRMDTSSTVST